MCLYLIRHGPSPLASGLREKEYRIRQLDMAIYAWLAGILGGTGAVLRGDTCLHRVLLHVVAC